MQRDLLIFGLFPDKLLASTTLDKKRTMLLMHKIRILWYRGINVLDLAAEPRANATCDCRDFTHRCIAAKSDCRFFDITWCITRMVLVFGQGSTCMHCIQPDEIFFAQLRQVAIWRFFFFLYKLFWPCAPKSKTHWDTWTILGFFVCVCVFFF